MGSGETAPTMVKVHRRLLERLGPPPVPAVLLDTPFGFQENAREIAGRAVTYFRESLHAAIAVTGLAPGAVGGNGAGEQAEFANEMAWADGAELEGFGGFLRVDRGALGKSKGAGEEDVECVGGFAFVDEEFASVEGTCGGELGDPFTGCDGELGEGRRTAQQKCDRANGIGGGHDGLDCRTIVAAEWRFSSHICPMKLGRYGAPTSE